MKKFFAMAAFAALTMAGMTSCSNDDAIETGAMPNSSIQKDGAIGFNITQDGALATRGTTTTSLNYLSQISDFQVIGFYSDGSKVSITDTLTITTGTDEHILVNRMLGASEWEIPMSYWQDEDTLSLHVTGEGYSLTDTVWIQKTNMPHFESPDCPTPMFHEITAVRSTHHFIDSVTIVQAYVNYAQTENIQLHLFAAP